MTLTVTITCNGITRTAKSTSFVEVAKLWIWIGDLKLPRGDFEVGVSMDGYPYESFQMKFGKDL